MGGESVLNFKGGIWYSKDKVLCRMLPIPGYRATWGKPSQSFPDLRQVNGLSNGLADHNVCLKLL